MIEPETRVTKERKAVLPFVSFTFGIISLLVIFFGDDLMQVMTPFFYSLLFVLLIFIFVVMLIASIVFAFARVKVMSRKAFVPLAVNIFAFNAVVFLFYPLPDWRRDIEFWRKKDKYNSVVNWIDFAVQNEEVDLGDYGFGVIALPSEFDNVTPYDRVIVEKRNGDFCVEFPAIFGGMFEYEPRFWYCPSLEISEIPNGPDDFCEVQKAPSWYVCH